MTFFECSIHCLMSDRSDIELNMRREMSFLLKQPCIIVFIIQMTLTITKF